MQMPQDATGLGILIAGIGLGGAAIAFAYKTFKNGKNGNGDTALSAEKRTNTAVNLVLAKLDDVRNDLAEHEKETMARHTEIMNTLYRRDRIQ